MDAEELGYLTRGKDPGKGHKAAVRILEMIRAVLCEKTHCGTRMRRPDAAKRNAPLTMDSA
jgi:hypothetical protein